MSYIPYGLVQKPTGFFAKPQQAKVVQQIYQRHLAGDSLEGIADFLFREGIRSPQGKERWTRSMIGSLLSNKKYIGISRVSPRMGPAPGLPRRSRPIK